MKISFRSRSLISFSALGLTGIVSAWAQISPAPSSPTPKMVDEIKGYDSWTVANHDYVVMPAAVAQRCAPGNWTTKKGDLLSSVRNTVRSTFKGTSGPHDKKWLRVYVNSIGEHAMLTQKHPKYPVGTVIVKQKLPSVTITMKGQRPLEKAGSTPELLTVMIKREANYDKANGDWEFMVTDGKGEKVTERGKLPSCQGCHKPYEKTDYIVRSYLPASVMKSLKDLDEADTPKSEPAYIEPAK